MSRRPTTRPASTAHDRAAEWLGLTCGGLLLARFLVPAESADEGETLWIVAGWLLTATLAAWLAHRTGRFQLRLTWPDAAVAALCGSQCAAALGVWITGGDRRAALNMIWEWLGILVAFMLLRQLRRSAAHRRRLTSLLLTTGVVLAGLSLWQWGVWYPRVQATYSEWERLTAGEAGHGPDVRRRIEELERDLGPELLSLRGSSRAALKQRVIDSREPFGRFGLANTLGGVLAALLVLTSGCRPTGSRLHAVALLALQVLIAAALILTRSRTSWIAALVGLAFVAAARGWRRIDSDRVRGRLKPIAIAAGLLLVATGTAVALGAIDRQELTEAPKSLVYRLHYAAATVRLILDHPLCGVGPGNFRQRYLQYKLPEASEEISDPHNFLWEAAATGGVCSLAALLWVTALSGISWRAAWRGRDGVSADGSEISPPASTQFRWMTLVGVGTCAAVFLMQDLFARRTETQLLWLAAAWVPAAWIVDRIRRHTPFNAEAGTSAAAAGLTLTLTLLVAGGFSMPVVTLLWLTTTFVLGGSPGEESAGDGAIVGGRWGAHCACGCAGLLAGCLWTGWGPVTLSGMYRNGGNAALHVERRADRAVALLQSAAEADRLDPQPWRDLSFAYAALARSDGPNAERQFTAAAAAAREAIARDPYNSHGYRWLGELWAGRAGDPDFPAAGSAAVEAYQRAVDLAPTVARLRAEFAHALDAAGRAAESKREAETALALNEINCLWRHFDKVLTLDELADLRGLGAADGAKDPP